MYNEKLKINGQKNYQGYIFEFNRINTHNLNDYNVSNTNMINMILVYVKLYY